MSDTPHYVTGYFAVMAMSRPETWQQASDEILREVYRLARRVGRARRSWPRRRSRRRPSWSSAGRPSKQAADSLGRSYLTADDPLFDKTYVDGIQKVTAEQVRDVARRYLVPQRLNRVIIAPPGGAPKQAEKAAKAAEGEIRSVRLPNGLRVLVKRHSPTAAGQHPGLRPRRLAGR